MKYIFTLLMTGPDATEYVDALFNAGCDDATFGRRDDVSFAEFDREAPTLRAAVLSAIADVEGAVPGLQVYRVEPEEYVTASEIAKRTGRSRESVRQLFEGSRGPGGFPKPVAWLSDRTRVWNWSEVSGWFMDARLGSAGAPDAEWIGISNALLKLRSYGVSLSDVQELWEILSASGSSQSSTKAHGTAGATGTDTVERSGAKRTAILEST